MKVPSISQRGVLGVDAEGVVMGGQPATPGAPSGDIALLAAGAAAAGDGETSLGAGAF
jgi:hypothetical protein